MARATNTLPVHTEHMGEMEDGMGAGGRGQRDDALGVEIASMVTDERRKLRERETIRERIGRGRER